MKKYYEDYPEKKQKMSYIKKKYYEENPEAINKNKEALKKYYMEHPEKGKEHSERMKQYYEEHPEEKQKMSYIKSKNKPFDIFTIDKQFIKTFNYQYDAKEFLKKEYNIKIFIKIGEVLSGKRKSSAGFVFKYK